MLYNIHLFAHIRVFDVKEEFLNGSPRLEQFYSLFKLFLEYPLFGSGFGSNADIIRSREAFYSYELTYIALIAKIGIIGSFLLGYLLYQLIKKTFIKFKTERALYALSFLIFIFITSTNPYLLNFYGLTIISLWISLIITNKN